MFEFRICRASDFDGRPCEEAYRVEGRRGWFIRFDDMMEVMDFIRRIDSPNGVIFGEDHAPADMRGNSGMEIVIYDDYME